MLTLPETSDKQALKFMTFPEAFLNVIWRNWKLVDLCKLSYVLETTEDKILECAELLGLEPYKKADDIWVKRGYLTIIRNNWHLLDYSQLMNLLGLSEHELAFILKEDDFMWFKMDCFKPQVINTKYRELSDEEKLYCISTANYLKTLGVTSQTDNAFEFLKQYYSGVTDEEFKNNTFVVNQNDKSIRFIYSYFALYGDCFLNPEIDPFPDRLLLKYAEAGINGIWLQAILYQLLPFKFMPSISENWEIRLKFLKNLVKRAKRFGIGVYLYLNEPRSMEKTFFDKYPDLRGHQEGEFFSMCTSMPEVQEYLRSSMFELFTRVPDLAGYFTITMSENLTNCYSRTPGHITTCPRCKDRNIWEVIAEVNNLLAEGAHKAKPDAEAIAYEWGWDKAWNLEVVDLMNQNQIVLAVSETEKQFCISGITGDVIDYSISIVGPGEKAKRIWDKASCKNLRSCAKVQINNSWELSAVPFIPVYDLIFQHIINLKKAKVNNLMLSWTLGGCPSVNLEIASLISKDNITRNDFIEILQKNYGELSEIVDKSQKMFSSAFSEFPFHIGVIYNGPQNFGPMAQFFTESTGFRSSMIGFPYDHLEGWRAIYPEDVFENQFEKLVSKWSDGVSLLNTQINYQNNTSFNEYVTISKAALCHFKSTYNQIRFVRLRDKLAVESNAETKDNILSVIHDEESVVLETIKLRLHDSRIGYEASNHYYYTLQDLKEKLINLKICKEYFNKG